MRCPECNRPLPEGAAFCNFCGGAKRQAARYAAPEGFVFDAVSGLFCRTERDAAGGVIGATWFDAVTGEYRQSRYDEGKPDAPPVPPAVSPVRAAVPVPEGFTEDRQSGLYYRYTVNANPQTGGEQWITWFNPATGDYRQERLTAPAAVPRSDMALAGRRRPAEGGASKGKRVLAVCLSLFLLIAAGGAVWLTGLYKQIPFLNPEGPPNRETEEREPDEPPAPAPLRKEIDHEAHLSTEFTLSRDGAGNPQAIDSILILFDGEQPEMTAEDIPGVVMTRDGQPIPVEYEVAWTVHGEVGSIPAWTSYEILFDPSSEQTAVEGVYAFSCTMEDVAYFAGDFYFAPPAGAEIAGWAAAYSDFLKEQLLSTKEYLHFSDWGVFPVHRGESELAVMQVDFYEIPGFDYPVMVLVEFLPQESNPDALDTFHFLIAYLVKDGAVTWERTEEEEAAIYYENEESGMTFVNGEIITGFELVSWDGSASAAEENLHALYDWLDSQTEG